MYKSIIMLIAFVTACGISPLPRCSDVGCRGGAQCESAEGPCYCPQPNGAQVECEAVPKCAEIGCEADCQSGASFTCHEACEC